MFPPIEASYQVSVSPTPTVADVRKLVISQEVSSPPLIGESGLASGISIVFLQVTPLIVISTQKSDVAVGETIMDSETSPVDHE